ncbi:hypothetical protein Barb7_01124 [Bacteroidales bacterium Barb7]|nr:hypothetical protein Barb7_01124 [Bacteroidales bacterium Barb7]
MIGLLITSLLTGASLIFVGFLSKRNPTLISGYHKLDEYQKKVFPDIAKKAMVTTGWVMIIGCFVSFLIKWSIGLFIFLIFPALIMSIYMVLKGDDISKKSTKILLLFPVSITILITVFLFVSSKEPSIHIEHGNINITGLYGETVPIKEIKHIQILDTIPEIRLRTNGFAFGSIRKGHFLVEGLGNVKLFLSSSSAPYIEIQTLSDQYIIVNFKNADKTINIYNEIKKNYD